MIFGVKSNFVGAALSAGGNRRDRTQIKGRFSVVKIKHPHSAMGIGSPELVVRSHHDTAWTHSLCRSAGVVWSTYPVESRNPAQEQIVPGVKNVYTGIARFTEIVPRCCLIDPANVEPERIARYKDRANKFGGLIQIFLLILSTTLSTNSACAQGQS